jgi:hypothetical protein
MNKQSFLSLLRVVLTAVGAYLIGRDLFGSPIDSSVWDQIIGAVLTVASIVWGIKDKTATIEMVQSGVRSVLVVIGGMLVASGKIKAELLTALLGIAAIIIPWIQSGVSRKKVDDIKAGKIAVADLKGSTKPVTSPNT